MNTKDQLMQEKAKLLRQIAESAQRGKSQEVLAASERLNKIDSLIERYEKLLRDISGLSAEESKTQPLEDAPMRPTPAREKNYKRLDAVSGREIGRRIRTDFLENVSKEGLHLRHIRDSIYETHSAYKVGIAVATERKPDRWFLGLPFEGFDHAVLLCKRDAGGTVEICLPKSFFDQYGQGMSESGGQVKFNVARRGNAYAMLVPGAGRVNVSKFVGNYSLLK